MLPRQRVQGQVNILGEMTLVVRFRLKLPVERWISGERQQIRRIVLITLELASFLG